MEVASEMTQYKHESSMEITDRTRTVVGVCLNVMYEQMYDDPRRQTFSEIIDSYIRMKFLEPTTGTDTIFKIFKSQVVEIPIQLCFHLYFIESHVRATVAITTLLKNAPELGSGQIGKDGVLAMMLSMAQSEERIQQIVAAEALIAASAKKKDSNMIVRDVSF